jgi:hypothetical protein
MNMFDVMEKEIFDQFDQLDESEELTMEEIVRIEWLVSLENEFEDAGLALGLGTLQDMSL